MRLLSFDPLFNQISRMKTYRVQQFQLYLFSTKRIYLTQSFTCALTDRATHTVTMEL